MRATASDRGRHGDVRGDYESPDRCSVSVCRRESDDTQAGEVCGVLLASERITLRERLDTARDVLPRGVDVQWGEWLQGPSSRMHAGTPGK